MDGMSKLENLIVIAQQLEYVPPSTQEDQWEMFDVIFAAINVAMHNPIQIRACLILSKKFTFFRMINSTILKKYIKRFAEGVTPTASDFDSLS